VGFYVDKMFMGVLPSTPRCSTTHIFDGVFYNRAQVLEVLKCIVH